MARLRSPRLLQCRCVDHHETPPLRRKVSLWQLGRPKTSWSLLRNFSNTASGSYALILWKMPQFSSQQKELKKNALLSSLTASHQKPPDFHKPMNDIQLCLECPDFRRARTYNGREWEGKLGLSGFTSDIFYWSLLGKRGSELCVTWDNANSLAMCPRVKHCFGVPISPF